MDEKWIHYVDVVDFAFQPIVNLHSGECLGVEVLLRDYLMSDFKSIQDFFNKAYKDKALFTVDILLQDKALKKFTKINAYKKMKMFYNVDNRLLFMPDYIVGKSASLLKKYELDYSSISLEVSQEPYMPSKAKTKETIDLYKGQLYKIAIDDFGTGFMGLQLIYETEPDYIKIDRFFLEDVLKDGKKKLFLNQIMSIAKILSIQTIAVGVESVDEYNFCREIGFDYVQGYLIQKPVRDALDVKFNYPIIHDLNRKKSLVDFMDGRAIRRHIKKIQELTYPKDGLKTLILMFQKDRKLRYIPIINDHSEPIGLIYLRTLLDNKINPHNKDLDIYTFMNKKIPLNFIKKRPVCDLNNRIETMLDLFSVNSKINELFVTENSNSLNRKNFCNAHYLI